VIAKVLHLVFAEPAIPIRSAHPRDANAAALRYSLGRTLYNLTDDLMTWNQARPQWRRVILYDVQVGTADTTSDDTQKYMTRLKLRTGNVFDAQM
jgi:hypothetical protein